MTPIVSSWFSSASCAIKFNFDTSFTSSTKEAFSGVVARNSTGLIMAACLLHHSDVNDFFIAKARACEDAVNFAIELGFRKSHSLTSVGKEMRQLMYSPRPIVVSSFPDTGLKKHRWKSNEWPSVISESRFKL
ncbi:hypothetical protein V6N12_010758 [Hibiscus sabdariffa]|uniref:RNase H type-1 domain-containing protein n=1 Tax=Hibiscus sabdariffa TaxID=183260 RepID=A0ABR2EL37_9ROSI